MTILSKILGDGARNHQVLVTGFLESDCEPTIIVDLNKIRGTPRGVKVTSALWIIQEKMGLRLFWGIGQNRGADNLILIAESRNSVKFEDGLGSPQDDSKWDRCIWLESFNCTLKPMGFTFLLDLDKQ